MSDAVNAPSEAAVLAAVRSALREIVRDDWIETIPIEMTTSFAHDLELESIEFVALAERLSNVFAGVNFAAWLAGMELHQILALTVGDLVRYIRECSSSPATT